MMSLFQWFTSLTAPADSPKRVLSTGLPVWVEPSSRCKRASGYLKEEKAVIRVPLTWSTRMQAHAVDALIPKLSAAHLKQRALHQHFQSTHHALLEEEGKTLCIETLDALNTYVDQLNAQTFQAPLKGVKIGRAKYSQLAQVNLRTGVMTISRYCLGDAIPAEAFRYLVLHELAHFQEANHSQRFWTLVAQYCPDYKVQRQLMRLYFRSKQREVPHNNP